MGITCPFWYARAGVVMAVETAHSDGRARPRKIAVMARQSTSELLRNITPGAESRHFEAAAKRMVNSVEGIKYFN